METPKKILFNRTEFIASFSEANKIPLYETPEIAFLGRSNVGKSSLLNSITGLRKLAFVSNTPGRTSLINYFDTKEGLYLTDCPGYGYAKKSKSDIKAISDMLSDYLSLKRNRKTVIFLIDISIPPQDTDLHFLQFMYSEKIEFQPVFTKRDKPNQSEFNQNLNSWNGYFDEKTPKAIFISNATQRGIEELALYMRSLIRKN